MMSLVHGAGATSRPVRLCGRRQQSAWRRLIRLAAVAVVLPLTACSSGTREPGSSAPDVAAASPLDSTLPSTPAELDKAVRQARPELAAVPTAAPGAAADQARACLRLGQLAALARDPALDVDPGKQTVLASAAQACAGDPPEAGRILEKYGE